MKTVVTDIGARYGARQILDGISFTLGPGEIVGLVGPNGHGKTTLMKRMLDLMPGTGSATFDGAPYSALDTPQRRVGTLLSTEGFHPGRSALNHLRLVGAVAGVSRLQAQSALNLVGLGNYAKASPSSYSMGMKQRLGLAAALMCEPQLLILDEPTNGLDMDGVIWFRNTIRSLALEGRTILLSTHILAELEKVADRVLILHTGRLRADCPMEEIRTLNVKPVVTACVEDAEGFAVILREKYGAAVVTTGNTLTISGLTAPEVGALAHQFGHAVSELGTAKPTLEDSYASIVGLDESGRLPEQAA
ncbi:ABC transporter ATP-binding protein [Pseudarthrobacter cellobiosi]|uniref:ABC transporter ATP-binding protein n=1 Tax=Pseudarthrobacter cellobiosi TaxID=2953654 RepID=UPI00208E0DF5|nr:ATP-binding cassette domain-containing protein [Pseudarthrobacter sp. HLT1-5]MCO4254633.1 ATP-binding cassette domain-containing protein [Pseudarthrobacter sp. HLT1-5]